MYLISQENMDGHSILYSNQYIAICSQTVQSLCKIFLKGRFGNLPNFPGKYGWTLSFVF
jgi:hypothetical protein